MQLSLLTGIDQELATVLLSWKLSAMHIKLISLSHKERNKANNIFLLLNYCMFSCLVHCMWTMVTLFLLAFTFLFFFWNEGSLKWCLDVAVLIYHFLGQASLLFICLFIIAHFSRKKRVRKIRNGKTDTCARKKRESALDNGFVN